MPLLVLAAVMCFGKANAAGQMALPSSHKHVYSETANPRMDIQAALKEARATHKRVILDFGADWCGDCLVLDLYFHQQPNLELVEKNFVIVHVWVGRMDQHMDVAHQYGLAMQHGVPALAVLDAHGKVLYAQSTSDFSAARGVTMERVTAFLEKWKA